MYKDNYKICVVGWHFYPKLYQQLKEIKDQVYIVAHRYNKLLDDLSLNYSVTKNVGVEFEAYDWYIKNIWNRKSNVIFMHDDVRLKDLNLFEKISFKSLNYDYLSVLGKTCPKKQVFSNRLFCLSKKAINLYMEKFGGIWFDENNRGYTLGKYGTRIYDNRYTKSYNEDCMLVGKGFKETLRYLKKEYNLKIGKSFFENIVLSRRGKDGNTSDKKLNDNTIFGRKENELEKIAAEEGTSKSRIKHYYTKWYNFYFSSIRYDNLNILEIGAAHGRSLKTWQRYFINSTIYGIECNPKHVKESSKKGFKIFMGDQSNIKFLKKVCKSVPLGFDVIIDNGDHKSKDQISSFEYLFEKLAPGGIYVIEDLQNNYSKKYENVKGKTCIDFLKKVIDEVNYGGKYLYNNYEHLVFKGKNLSKYQRLICGMVFHAGICFVFKRFCK